VLDGRQIRFARPPARPGLGLEGLLVRWGQEAREARERTRRLQKKASASGQPPGQLWGIQDFARDEGRLGGGYLDVSAAVPRHQTRRVFPTRP
jgi:hypothetical protein